MDLFTKRSTGYSRNDKFKGFLTIFLLQSHASLYT